MDLSFLHSNVQNSLEEFHIKTNIRYRNIGFSSKSLRDLDDVTHTLRELLPNYALWELPSMQTAPKQTISRKGFQEKILAIKHEGLIIHQPEQWLSQWSLLEKQAFWSALGMSHANKKVVFVSAESDEFQQTNNGYFKSQLLDGLSINLWRPVRAA